MRVGDFNELLFHHKKVGGAQRSDKQMDAFKSILNLCKLNDFDLSHGAVHMV